MAALLINDKMLELGEGLDATILAIAKKLGYTNRSTPEEKLKIKQEAIRTLYDYLGSLLY